MLILIILSSICLLSSGIEVKEHVTETTEMVMNQTVNVSTIKNDIKIDMDMLRITQPSSGNIESYANTKQVKPNETMINNNKKIAFKASPQLESYIEYNRFPVAPAWPESKQVKTFQQHFQNYQYQNPVRVEKNNFHATAFYTPSSTTVTPISVKPWPSIAEDKQSLYTQANGKPLRTDNDLSPLKFYDKYNFGAPTVSVFPTAPTQSNYDWYNNIAFPTKPASLPEHPYPFVTQEELPNPVPKHETYSTHLPIQHPIIYEHESSLEEHHMPKKNPWKKIIKFLTAIIPIGLLLSALSPNVLNIGPAYNASQFCRKDGARLEDGHEYTHIHEKLTTYECTAREICDISVTGNTPSIDAIRRIVALATYRDNDSDTLQLDIISKAVKQKQCDLIKCNPQKRNQNQATRRKSRIKD